MVSDAPGKRASRRLPAVRRRPPWSWSAAVVTLRGAGGLALGAATRWLASGLATLRGRRDGASALLSATGTGVLVCAADGRVTRANAFARQVFDRHADDRVAVDRWLSSVELFHVDGVTPVDPDRLDLARGLREGGLDGVELVVAPRSGIPRRVVVYTRPATEGPGGARRTLAVIHDVTAARRAEPAAPEAMAGIDMVNPELAGSLARLEAFAGMVSHDLKGPLVAITGYAQLLQHLAVSETQPAEYEEYLAEIVDGVETMHRLIDSHLAFAVANEAPLDRAEVDLTEIVASVVARHVHHSRHVGEPVPAIFVSPIPPVLGESGMIRQIVDNLVGNALKYTRPGQPAELRISGRLNRSGEVYVEFADRGVGVPDGQRDQIFANFHRAHRDADYAGTGLGLSICRGIVERHGGRIGCLPNPGGGSRFWFTLPAGDDPVDARCGGAVRPGEAAAA